MNIFKIIYNEIKKYKKIYIARHIGPDPDAFGSQMSLKETILESFPDKEVYAVGCTVAKFKYFGKVDKVSSFDYENSLLIILDTPDYKRVDIDNVEKFKNIVKIDHHPQVDIKANVDLTDVSASSASELIYMLIKETRLKMNANIAKNIYYGIISDTNRFLYNASYKTLDIVSDLLKKYKLKVPELNNELYKRPLSEIRVMGHIASTLKVDKNGFAYIELDEELLTSLGSDVSAPSNMINDFNNVNEITVWTFITYDRKNEIYKVNIRSNGPEINKIAAKYNGGGHKLASGVRTQNKEDVDLLIKDLQTLCREYKKERDEKYGSN